MEKPEGVLFSSRAGKRIRKLREELDWSRERLAHELAQVGQSLGQNGIYKIEQQPPARRLTVDELGALAVVLGTTPHELMGWNEDDLAGLWGWDVLTSSQQFERRFGLGRGDLGGRSLDELKGRMVELVIELKNVEREYDEAAAQIALVEGYPGDDVLAAAVNANLRQSDLRAEILRVTNAIADLGELNRG